MQSYLGTGVHDCFGITVRPTVPTAQYRYSVRYGAQLLLACEHCNLVPVVPQYRIVFDEGHTLKSTGSKLFKAAVELAADRKWLCTGTPLASAVDDLQVGSGVC